LLNPLENDWSPHNADNAPLDIYLPPDRVQHAVQLVARDERRHNFSLNSLRNKDGSLPPNFGEWALPGVHSDIGGGYADLVMERVLLAPVAYLKEMDFSSPERSYAYKRLETLREKIADEGWLGVHNQPPGRLFIERVDQPGIDRIILKLLLERPVRGEYSRVSLRLMHELAQRQGVPFKNISPTDLNYHLPPELEPVYQALRQHVLEGAPLNLSDSLQALLKQRYHHHSDHYEQVGPVMPHRPVTGQRGIHPNLPGRN